MPNKGKLQFVTEPLLETIEGEEILLLPFFLPDLPAVEGDYEANTYTPKNERLKAISDLAALLGKSTNKHEAFS